jgi:hypothetical protein
MLAAATMPASPPVEGFPPNCALIEVHVTDLKQLYDSLDPTPFHKRDLDPKAEEFIVGWARELDADVPLGLLVHADRIAHAPQATDVVHTAVRDHFRRKAEVARQNLRQLFRVGRRSLVIGLGFLAACLFTADTIERTVDASRLINIVRESLIIGGWVAMWRPIEIFLYEWWPIRAEARLHDRLSGMTVRVVPHHHPQDTD